MRMRIANRTIAIMASCAIVLAFFICFVTAELPPGFTTCKKSDSDCLVKAIEDAVRKLDKGFKNLGVSGLDPLRLEKVHIPGNGGSVDLEQDFSPLDIIGLSSAKITNVKVNIDGGDCSMRIEANIDTLALRAQHRLRGKMMVFQLNGHGRMNVTMVGMDSRHDLKCERYQKNGAEYIKVTDYVFDFGAKRVYYDFDSVVDGNKQLSDEIVRVANENDQEILEEIRRDHGRTYGVSLKAVANQIFDATPVDQIFL